jgi:hypothetical protein
MTRTLAATVVLIVLVAAMMTAIGCAKKAPTEEPPATANVPTASGDTAPAADVNAEAPADNAAAAVDENAEAPADNAEAAPANAS